MKNGQKQKAFLTVLQILRGWTVAGGDDETEGFFSLTANLLNRTTWLLFAVIWLTQLNDDIWEKIAQLFLKRKLLVYSYLE